MKPTIQLATSTTPEGQTMVLCQHDQDFYITIDQYTLMTSRERESELELARLGCSCLASHANPHVLIGGLGMCFTLRQTLDLLPAQAKVTVVELIPEVITWNREFLGELTDHPLQDARVQVINEDVRDVIAAKQSRYDAILLDTDNGPSAFSVPTNAKLYQPSGVHALMNALKPEGCLAIWSSNSDAAFEKLLRREKFFYRLVRVRAAPSSKSRSRFIWLIVQRREWLPQG